MSDENKRKRLDSKSEIEMIPCLNNWACVSWSVLNSLFPKWPYTEQKNREGQVKGVRMKTCAVVVKYDHNILVLTVSNKIKYSVHFRADATVSASHNVLVLVFSSHHLCLRSRLTSYKGLH